MLWHKIMARIDIKSLRRQNYQSNMAILLLSVFENITGFQYSWLCWQIVEWSMLVDWTVFSGWDGNNHLSISNQYRNRKTMAVPYKMLIKTKPEPVILRPLKHFPPTQKSNKGHLPQRMRLWIWKYVNKCNLLTLAYNVGSKINLST